MPKPKIAIYDFTDCEGCEVKIVNLKEALLTLEQRLDIVNWRLGQANNQPGPFDICLIEGTPITKHEVELLKELRKQSKILVGLGSCATLAGIPGIMDQSQREQWYDKIYGKGYKPIGIDAVPLSEYVDVDYLIHGCPVDEAELARVFQELLAGKTPQYHGYSVCKECKEANNGCRILDKKPCLGPITQGGCGAVCISGGSPCYGCFGIRQEANIGGLKKVLSKFATKKEIDSYLSMFLKREMKKHVK